MKGNKGITLIALVITIIVLLILAGVSIAMLSGDNSILGNAAKSADYNKIGEAKDQISLKVSEYVTSLLEAKYNNGTYVGDTDATAEELKAKTATTAVNDALTAVSGADTLVKGVTITNTPATEANPSATPPVEAKPATIKVESGEYYDEADISTSGSVSWKGITQKTN